MFGKKKNQSIQKTITANFDVIPQEFYGTKDPVVHYQSGVNKVIKNKNTSNPKISFSFLDFFKNKKVLLVIGIIIFVALVGGIIWYYLWDAGIIKISQPTTVEESVKTVEPTTNKPENTSAQTEIKDIEIVSSTTEMVTTTSDEEIINELSNQEIEINFPKVMLTNSVDLDSDSLTDVEEEIFGTDSGNSDTDGDGYYDGQEVNNLYNPKGIAPVKLIDSGLAAEYTNPKWQYRIYYPIGWQIGEVDNTYQQVLFSSASGDYIEVLVMQKNNGESFNDWFARKAIGQKITDLQNFQNRFQEAGQRRQDNLVNYFIQDNNIYIIIYHPASENGFISYRHVVQMMVQSFRPTKTAITIPEQTVLPSAPTEAEIEDIFANSIQENTQPNNTETNTTL